MTRYSSLSPSVCLCRSALIITHQAAGNDRCDSSIVFRLCDNGFLISLCGGTPVVAITLAAAASPWDSKANNINISLGRNNTVVLLVVTAVGTRRISDDVREGRHRRRR